MVDLVKYRKPVRILHWVNAVAFVVLFLTGLILFIPGLSFLATDGWTRLIHRIGAVVFIIGPLLYLVINPKGTTAGLKKAFAWGSEDKGWLQAAPRYYFLGDEAGMPPQGEMNTGQKLWWLITIVFGGVFVLTGLVMWFAPSPPALLQWMVLIHDVAFIFTGSMFLLHLYLGVLHPMMTEAWRAMTTGRVSANYARTHHGRWYEEMTGSGDPTE